MPSLSFVITLDKELPDAQAAYAKTKSGKAIARELDKINSVARRKNVEPISAMLSESPAAIVEQMKADGFDPSKMRIPPEIWYAPAEGIKTAKAIWQYVTDNLNDFKQPNPILKDLKAIEALLTAAEAAGVKFHFTSNALG